MTKTEGANARPRARARDGRPGMRPFRALDGEAVTIGRGDRRQHLYVLLGTDDDAIEDPAGLATSACFDWILRQALRREILVSFAFNYDVNMIVRDVPRLQLRELWKLGECDVELDGLSYSLEWIPGKLFGISVVDPDTDRRIRAKVWDCWGFFQASFVRALEQWDVDDDTGTIAEMKRQRSRFTLDMADEIRAYNAAECRLLVELMNRVRDALHAVELKPRSWLGAGSIASALLHKHRIAEQLETRAVRSPTLDEDVIMRAYFGGRTEVFRQGCFDDAIALDINSAYPSAAITLPSTRGRWKRRREYMPDEPYAIWRVRWQLDNGGDESPLIAPFPYRMKRSIFYPLAGEGWYHACELSAAIAAFGEGPFDVSTGYVFTPADETRPLGFIADVFEQRRQLKRDGHPSEKVLKLGINSVYGKLAQGASRKLSGPPFQDYFWAGYITAHTRARMLSAIAAAATPIAVATDGLIVAGAEPTLEIGPGLGQWERTRYRNLFVAQPGMYYAHASRRRVKRSRGFFTREIDFPALRRTWLDDGPDGLQRCKTTRFVGLGTALLRNDFDVWRTWETGVRKLSLYSARKFYGARDVGKPARVLYPPSIAGAGLSERYVPKTNVVELDPDDAEWIQGNEQPQLAGD